MGKSGQKIRNNIRGARRTDVNKHVEMINEERPIATLSTNVGAFFLPLLAAIGAGLVAAFLTTTPAWAIPSPQEAVPAWVIGGGVGFLLFRAMQKQASKYFVEGCQTHGINEAQDPRAAALGQAAGMWSVALVNGTFIGLFLLFGCGVIGPALGFGVVAAVASLIVPGLLTAVWLGPKFGVAGL